MGKMDKTMEKKVLNDMVASGRSLAGERGRNADWMEKAIRQSVSIPATEAVKLKVVDLMADNLEDLLAKINGRKVEVGGKQLVLHTAGVPVREIPEGLRFRVLKYIADPNIAFILMMIGLAGLYFEWPTRGWCSPGSSAPSACSWPFSPSRPCPSTYIGVMLILPGFYVFHPGV